jgi:hypothetical protein
LIAFALGRQPDDNVSLALVQLPDPGRASRAATAIFPADRMRRSRPSHRFRLSTARTKPSWHSESRAGRRRDPGAGVPRADAGKRKPSGRTRDASDSRRGSDP